MENPVFLVLPHTILNHYYTNKIKNQFPIFPELFIFQYFYQNQLCAIMGYIYTHSYLFISDYKTYIIFVTTLYPFFSLKEQQFKTMWKLHIQSLYNLILIIIKKTPGFIYKAVFIISSILCSHVKPLQKIYYIYIFKHINKKLFFIILLITESKMIFSK